MAQTTVGVRFPSEVVDKIDQVAAELGLDRSGVVRMVMDHGLDHVMFTEEQAKPYKSVAAYRERQRGRA